MSGTGHFLDTSRPFPYCAGCGHPHVLRALDEALAGTGCPPHRFVLVTDIGCVGLADAYFPTLHTVHALHGRAAAIATGMQIAASREEGGMPLKPIVLVGDGGASIGLLHLVHGAQLNVDVTVLVHNNLIYGMTGGQHSGFTPDGMPTTTTPEGNLLPPLDLGTILSGAGLGFFARAKAPGPDLAARLTEAIQHPGFAVVEALELCPTFAARVGGMTGKGLDRMADERQFELGHVRLGPDRPAFLPPRLGRDADPTAGGIRPEPGWALVRDLPPLRCVVAGRAGERVQSAAKLAARAALAAGLHTTVRTDNPVTQGKGFSLAELTVASGPIHYTGAERPDHVLVVAEEGLAEAKARRLLDRSVLEAGRTRVVVDERLPCPPGAQARDLRRRFGAKDAALGALVETLDAAVEGRGLWRAEAWEAAMATLPPKIREANEAVLAKARAARDPATPSG